jgi:diketogulonate reductase-like aldo/keto reductase
VEAWAPLGFGSDLLKEQILIDIAKAHGKTAAQVALRFLIENGIRVIPKSVNASRQQENFDIFDFALTEAEMEKIRALNKHHRLHDDPDRFL